MIVLIFGIIMVELHLKEVINELDAITYLRFLEV